MLSPIKDFDENTSLLFCGYATETDSSFCASAQQKELQTITKVNMTMVVIVRVVFIYILANVEVTGEALWAACGAGMFVI